MGSAIYFNELRHIRLADGDGKNERSPFFTNFDQCHEYDLGIDLGSCVFFAVKGVAAATLISELTAFVLGAWIILKHTSNGFRMPSIKQMMDTHAVKKMFHVNKDLFIRTICLLVVINMFTAKGASFGTELLAANAILFKFITSWLICSMVLPMHPVFLLAGQLGQRPTLYDKTLTLSRQWAVVMACHCAAYFLFKVPILSLFTNFPQLLDVTLQYADWLVLYPFAACFGLVIYGVFTGATEIAPVRNSMLFAMILFMAVQTAVTPIWHNENDYQASIRGSNLLSIWSKFLQN